MSHRGELSKQFLSEHKTADELVYDIETKLPICAIYLNLEYADIKERTSLLIRITKSVIMVQKK